MELEVAQARAASRLVRWLLVCVLAVVSVGPGAVIGFAVSVATEPVAAFEKDARALLPRGAHRTDASSDLRTPCLVVACLRRASAGFGFTQPNPRADQAFRAQAVVHGWRELPPGADDADLAFASGNRRAYVRFWDVPHDTLGSVDVVGDPRRDRAFTLAGAAGGTVLTVLACLAVLLARHKFGRSGRQVLSSRRKP